MDTSAPISIARGGEATDEEVAAIVGGHRGGLAAPCRRGLGRSAAPVAVLGPVVDQAGPAPPQPPLVTSITLRARGPRNLCGRA